MHLIWNRTGGSVIGLTCYLYTNSPMEARAAFAHICMPRKDIEALRDELSAKEIATDCEGRAK
jgi:hypothetical protein